LIELSSSEAEISTGSFGKNYKLEIDLPE